MKSNLKKRIIAFMLCMVMVLSSNSVAALATDTDAEGQTPEATAEAAGQNAAEEAEEVEEQNETPVSEPAPEVAEPAAHQDAVELKQEIKDADGQVIFTVKAQIPEGTFEANTEEVTMEVAGTDDTTAETIKNLMTKQLAEDKELGAYFLYNIAFKVNGEVTEPGQEITITFEPKDFRIEDTAKANVFYYSEANSAAGNTEAEIKEIAQRAEVLEALQNAGESTDNIEEYDLTDITLRADKTTEKIQTEGRRSTVYGCYLEEKKPEEVVEEPKAEEPEEETTEETTEETKSPQELHFENDDVTVTVSADKEGVIPEGATLQVIPILADRSDTEDQYKEVEEQLNKKAENEDYDIAGFLAYDISFLDKDGKETEPNGGVKVTMEYKEKAIPEGIEDSENLNTTVMHLEEDGDGKVKEVVDMAADEKQEVTVETTSDAKVTKAEFKTDSFSTYTVTWLAASSAKTVTVENTILAEGTLNARYAGGESKSITWYKSDSRAGDYSKVDRVQYQGDASNISPEGTKLYPAFDEGARKWYKAEVTFSDNTSVTSDPVQVVYYDELQNGSFEKPKSDSHDGETSDSGKNKAQWSNAGYAKKGGVWQTTGEGTGKQSDQDIEVLWTGNTGNKDQFTYHSKLTAADGEQFAEINCEAAGALYQEVLTIPGTELNYEFYHRARDCKTIKYRWPNNQPTKYDTMYLAIAPASEVQECNTQEQLTQYLQEKGVTITSGAQGSDKQKEATSTLKDEDGLLVAEIVSDSTNWRQIIGEYVPTESLTRFFFVSGATASNDNTVGNFVDKISFSQDLPPVDETEFSLEIEKKFEGLDNEALTTVQQEIQFKITASEDNGRELSEQEIAELFGTNTIDGTKMKPYPDGSLHYSFKNRKIETGKSYKVTVTEVHAELSEYEWTPASTITVKTGDEDAQTTTGTTAEAVIASLQGETIATVEFTNSYNRAETKNVNFKKVWDDNNDAFNTRPSELSVTLKASIIVEENGTIVEKPLEEYTQNAVLNADNAWGTTWKTPVYYEYNGVDVKINYTVEEGEIDSKYVYEAANNGTAQAGTGEDYEESDFSKVTTGSDESKSQPNLRSRTSTVPSLSTANPNGVTATSNDSGLGEPAHNKYIEYNTATADYTLNLDVTGAKGTAKGADILFVIDTSGSMKNGLLRNLKTLLTEEGGIVDQIFATAGNVNSAAYVSFAGKSETKSGGWYTTKDQKTLKDEINNLKATGGTNWTYAMQRASSLMREKPNSTNEKVVIFLSDGKPTYTMKDGDQKGNGNDTESSYYEDAAKVVNDSSYLKVAKLYSVYLTKGTKDGMKTFADKVDNSELVNGTQLETALQGILNKVIPTYKNVIIKDTLSENVVFAETNPTITVTKETAAETKTTLDSGSYQATVVGNTVTVNLLGGASLEDGATYTVSFKVKPSDTANAEYSQTGYTDTGEPGTGSTSAGKQGFYSNVDNQTTVTYKVNDEDGSATYPMPVVQVTTHELNYQKEWVQPNGVSNPTADVRLHVTYTDGGENDIVLTSAAGYHYTERVPITRTIASITEEAIDGYTASYQISEDGKTATVTNSYERVTTNTIEVKKEWIGGTTKNPIQVSLYRSTNGQGAELYETQTLRESNEWKCTWSDLPIEEGSGSTLVRYTYAVREENSPPNYSSNIVYTYEEDKTVVTITNTYDSNCADENYYIANVLQTEDITLKKTWNDNNDVLRKRPDTLNITVNDFTFRLSSVNSWERTVTLLKKVGATYEVKEQLGEAAPYELEGSSEEKTENGITFSFTNKLKTTSITVHKDWNDGEIETRPKTISFMLQYKASGSDQWEKYETYSMTAENMGDGEPWSMLIEDLPATYEYQIVETNVKSGYHTSVTNSDTAFTITNTLNWKVIKTSTPIGDREATPLSGAEFELKKDTTTIATGISDEKGAIGWAVPEDSTVDLNELDGAYTIHETKAPSGYVISGDWTLTFDQGLLTAVTLDGQPVTPSSDAENGVVVKITNDVIYELPHTGGPGIYWYMVGGILLMLAAALILYKNKRRGGLES